MKTEVIMKRDLMGSQIRQKSKSEFFNANDLLKIGNKYRIQLDLAPIRLGNWLSSDSTQEFIKELSNKYGIVMETTKGRSGGTWMHPLLFIDLALSINPKFKVEVYEWIYDHLVKYRNDSGNTFREMSSALYGRFGNKQAFPNYIKRVSNHIRNSCKVTDWNSATEDQLELRDKIHESIKLLCNVLQDTDQAVKLGVSENITS